MLQVQRSTLEGDQLLVIIVQKLAVNICNEFW